MTFKHLISLSLLISTGSATTSGPKDVDRIDCTAAFSKLSDTVPQEYLRVLQALSDGTRFTMELHLDVTPEAEKLVMHLSINSLLPTGAIPQFTPKEIVISVPVEGYKSWSPLMDFLSHLQEKSFYKTSLAIFPKK